MTATLIVETLAHEFSIPVESVQGAFEMLDAGLSTPFIGRFRRAQTGSLSESQIRRLNARRMELEELDRRRGTMLRTLEREEGIDASTLEQIRSCMDRFELEDLFVPHRRPEPEVQLALDRGLGALADLLVTPLPRDAREASAEDGAEGQGEDDAGPEPDVSADDAPATEPTPSVSGEAAGPEDASVPEGAEPAPAEAPAGTVDSVREDADERSGATIAGLPARIAITPELARACAPFVDPDKGIHTEAEALAGAVRILSDRLGRNPHLRSLVRRMLRKRGVLRVKALVEDGKAGRHKPLLKVRQPLRQIQGHRLLAIRQAQKERVLTTAIELDPSIPFAKVRAALGRNTDPAYDRLLDEIARQALEVRILPMVEADVRLELKERGDAEALRFLAQHLRQILLTPPLGRYPVVGLDVNARGDWTLAALEADGAVRSVARIELGEKAAPELGAEVAAIVGSVGARAIAVGHGKGARASVRRLRAALAAAGCDAGVAIVNETGLSSYSNSELARTELPDHAVPERNAISLGRRLQDPMAEILKVDPRHLGLGPEQGLVSKAGLKRALAETIESCVAHVGTNLNEAPHSVLRRVPGLDGATAQTLIERRREQPFANRERLRTDALLSEAQWTSAIAFLRIPRGEHPLDATSLHPELYDTALRLLESAGATVEEDLGRPGLTKGLRRATFDLDEATWRDLMRELSHPGRDPRPRLPRFEPLDPDIDPARLVPDRVVSGVVTNVASFGAFIDVGLEQDAMIHISEISSRYVRDARELLSIGEVVRARLLEAKGPRLSLSLKNVPEQERRARRRTRDGGPGRSNEDRTPLRAAQSRRDGLAGGRSERRGRGGPGGPGGGRGGGPGAYRGGRRGGRRDEAGLDSSVDLDQINAQTGKAAAYSPFASFFKGKPEDGDAAET